MTADSSYIHTFNHNILALFRDAARVTLHDPRLAAFMGRALLAQRRAVGRRQQWEDRGVHVPPFMIVSVTGRCNLHCVGCYARAHHPEGEPEMSAATLRRTIAEAEEAGISIILLAGGEPLTRPEILDITCDHPNVVFPLFTNGLLLDDALIDRLAAQRHVVPVISLEGHRMETDARRGRGVHRRVLATIARLRAKGMFTGVSFTVTSQNLGTVTDTGFVRDLMDAGARLFFYVDYVPVQPGTEVLMPTVAQREEEARVLELLSRDLPGLFVALPGDEESYGGCLAAGRGFVHVSASGRLEPCPFAPFSDTSVIEGSLIEALGSEFLRAIRESDVHLGEMQGGCALWEKRAWVANVLAETAAPAAGEAPSGCEPSVEAALAQARELLPAEV